MLEPVLRTIALVAVAFVLAGWGLFSIDEARSASNATTEEIAGREAARRVDPGPGEERARELANSGPREVVDDVNDVLLSPFSAIAGDEQPWLRRTVPALLGLLVYGFGLGVLARYAGR